MKSHFVAIFLAAGLLTLPAAYAQMGGMGPGMGPDGMSGMGMGGGKMKPHDMKKNMPACDQTPDPAKCEDHRKAHIEARAKAEAQCGDNTGPERRKCVRDIMMAQQDCATAPNPKRCAGMKAAYQNCQDKMGPALRDCMKAQVPAAPAKP
jgi:hypothetical protein